MVTMLKMWFTPYRTAFAVCYLEDFHCLLVDLLGSGSTS